MIGAIEEEDKHNTEYVNTGRDQTGASARLALGWTEIDFFRCNKISDDNDCWVQGGGCARFVSHSLMEFSVEI